MCSSRMGSSFSPYNILAFLSLFLFVVSTKPAADAEAATRNNHNLLQYVRRLNLSLRNDVNIVNYDPLSNASAKIVEKRFRFPSLCDNNETSVSAGPNVQDFSHYSGYFRLHHTKDARWFYYFFESRKKDSDAPVVVWLTGGPGCSSSIALFYENGPFHLTDNLSLVWNEYGWDQESNILYLDHPTGTGFSYSTNESDIRNTSEEVAADLYDFIRSFFKKHPEYAENDFYITGESYAGHSIPPLATRILHGNRNKQGCHINLKGMAMGSPWTNPRLQFGAYRRYALTMKLINFTQYNQMKQPFSKCQWQVHEACEGTDYDFTDCAQANIDCNDILFDNIITPMGSINYYDIRKHCDDKYACYDFSNMERFLNQASVKEALGVRSNFEFVSCSQTIYDAMLGDQMRSFADWIPELLQDGISLLVYAGEYDLLCNWMGNLEWVKGMMWSGRTDFLSARTVPFNVDGVKAGVVRTSGPLSFLKMSNAGHLVPMDQPKASLQMLNRWMKGIPL